ncbi:peptidoglycan glycosyltransferase [Lutibacter sp. B2]|nr:peptidoglycan glycosyltransferase [Lutibacter sp. B2]
MESRRERKLKKNQSVAVAELYINRVNILRVILIVIIVSLIGRLYYIQIVKGPELYQCAKNQSFKEIPNGIKRGKIYDRHMNLLTNEYTTKYLVIFPQSFPITNNSIEAIKVLTKTEIDKKLVATRPLKLEIVNDDKKATEYVKTLKGAFVIDYNERYSKEQLATHTIGYLIRVDNVGASGLEKRYDEILKEDQDYRIGAIVDAQKRMILGKGYQKFEQESLKNGKNLVTTLDSNIQRIVEKEFDKSYKKGSVVVLDVKTGDVLAMVSRPNFDPNNVASYLKNNSKELYNKAIQIAYPPGSIFKIIVAAAALESNEIDENNEYDCIGYEEIEGTKIKCGSYKTGGHGKLNLKEAFSKSCNSYFIQLGEKIGGEKILEMAEKFGLGAKTNIELLEETNGNLATKDYVKGAGVGNISIGQGTIETTPMQIAKMTSIIANEGIDKGIHLIKKIVNNDGDNVQTFNNIDGNRVISKETAKKIGEMMHSVVIEGTAKNIATKMSNSAGKTGSAESIKQGEKIVHAWFTGYFPYKEPKYIVTIFIEEGEAGGRVAAPLFEKIATRLKDPK